MPADTLSTSQNGTTIVIRILLGILMLLTGSSDARADREQQAAWAYLEGLWSIGRNPEGKRCTSPDYI